MLEDFDDDETEYWAFRELVGRLNISTVVRSVVRYCSALIAIRWKAALGILGYIKDTSWLGIIHTRNVNMCFFGSLR